MLKRLYPLAFLYTVHNALMMYINSSFLEGYISIEKISYIYSFASILSLVSLTFLPRLLTRFGHVRVTLSVVGLIIASLAGMLSGMWWVVISFFLIHEVMHMIMRVNNDIYIQEFATQSNIGSVRGSYNTALNAAIIISPAIVSFLLTNGDYWKVYSLALAVIVAYFFLLIPTLRKIPDIAYSHTSIFKTISREWHNRDIRNVFTAAFLLQFFFSWMVIFMPVYLHEHIGFEWSQIGLMFSIMLTAFVIFEKPLGYVADKWLGEKELLTAGFALVALATAVIPFIDSTSFALWTAVLFVSRTGAATIEIMSETYFFKKTPVEDTNAIEFFRDSRPLGYLIGPITASIALSFVGIQWLFLVLAVIMLCGTYFALRLKDTL